jgi:putative spermidine/putrescine transport system ATP-binding protein
MRQAVHCARVNRPIDSRRVLHRGSTTTDDVQDSAATSAGVGPGTPAVRLIGLRKTYGDVVAIERLSLEIAEGDFFTMLGPSGSGKTTTLRLIAGFEPPDSGAIELHGEDVSRRPPYQRPVNTVFQDYALFPHMSVAENVGYGLRVHGVAKREREQRVAQALEMVRLPDVGKRRPIQLSGGQRQRVALARAIVNRPRVLLLDEPLGALDLKLRQEMQMELKTIQRELSERITFVYVTHDQEEALTMSDRIAVFSEGRIEQVGTPGEIYERPANEFVAGFVGTSNIIERDGRRSTIRPEKIRMLDSAPADVPGEPGVVRDVVYLGSVTRYVVELDHGETLVVLRQNLETSAEAVLHERGRRVWLVWRPEDASPLRPSAGTNEEETDS